RCPAPPPAAPGCARETPCSAAPLALTSLPPASPGSAYPAQRHTPPAAARVAPHQPRAPRERWPPLAVRSLLVRAVLAQAQLRASTVLRPWHPAPSSSSRVLSWQTPPPAAGKVAVAVLGPCSAIGSSSQRYDL